MTDDEILNECKVNHMQNCHICPDGGCCDNTNPALRSVSPLDKVQQTIDDLDRRLVEAYDERTRLLRTTTIAAMVGKAGVLSVDCGVNDGGAWARVRVKVENVDLSLDKGHYVPILRDDASDTEWALHEPDCTWLCTSTLWRDGEGVMLSDHCASMATALTTRLGLSAVRVDEERLIAIARHLCGVSDAIAEMVR